eukprot:CAMPEP_0115487888 /NCGR_PEP_ID=MMETSP0271-20121206/61186_1 /TAXON_ID=71861 /ORGANISM="Scrippsiella trochoidea, Strain CCMP3099" /LENGTH=84 /DNA_ID=CAMNT_0002915949 /DNA_START=628 /DNA_END=877 /DNA_ORIENTATION=+
MPNWMTYLAPTLHSKRVHDDCLIARMGEHIVLVPINSNAPCMLTRSQVIRVSQCNRDGGGADTSFAATSAAASAAAAAAAAAAA